MKKENLKTLRLKKGYYYLKDTGNKDWWLGKKNNTKCQFCKINKPSLKIRYKNRNDNNDKYEFICNEYEFICKECIIWETNRKFEIYHLNSLNELKEILIEEQI